MSWAHELLEESSISLAYIVLGGFVVIFSMMSLLVKQRLYVNEVVLGTAMGIIMGPQCANVFNPRAWGDHSSVITLEFMRIVLATGLFAIGVELPPSYLAHHAKGLLVMIVPTMASGWLIVAGLIVAIFPGLSFVSALAIAACLTPTDPIICAAIVGGKWAERHVPENLRHIIAAESAANDGLAYPFLSLSLYLALESSYRTAFGKWLVIGCLYQVVLGIIIGAVMGLGFCQLMKQSHRLGFIDRESYVAQYLALAIFTTGVVSTIGSDDLLATFAAGSAIAWDGNFKSHTEGELFSSVIDYILNCGCFIYIGAWMPFEAFNNPELGITPGRLIALLVCILVLRRIPALLGLYFFIPEISGWREALFSGHFGPMGVGAVFVSTLAVSRLPTPANPPETQIDLLASTLQVIVAFVVLGSIFIHGLSIPFFSVSRKIRSRTLSVSRSWTIRHSSGPDWLVRVRRFPTLTQTPTGEGDTQPPAYSPPTGDDIEQGMRTEKKEETTFETAPEVIRVNAADANGIQEEVRTELEGRPAMRTSRWTSFETLVPMEPSVHRLSRQSSVSRFGGASINSRE